MDLLVRPARPEDAVRPAALRVGEAVLHRLRGQRARALKLLHARVRRARARRELRVLPRRDRRASELIGVVAGFPVRDGDRLSRRFIRLTLPRCRRGACPSTFRAPARRRRRRAASAAGRLLRRRARGRRTRYRRRGIAQRLLEDAEHAGRARRAARGSRSTPACRTAPARALYDAYGFRRARDPPRARRPHRRAR